jgi:pSer/pThr/pTyr-binding forkhead associated (FHA) protein
VALSTHTVLIGRTSSSRGVHPDIALDRDTGVSRRHAQLVSDGDQLTVVDLASTNGTYVIGADGDPDAEPDAEIEPLAPDEVRPLADGDRIYLGAWTRLTVRRR